MIEMKIPSDGNGEMYFVIFFNKKERGAIYQTSENNFMAVKYSFSSAENAVNNFKLFSEALTFLINN